MSQQQAHRRAVDASIPELVGLLQDLLSRRVTAYIAGVRDPKTVTRWANGEVTEIRNHEVEQRLRAAYTIAQMLLDFDDERTVKSWFVSLNPFLDNVAPAEAIRDGNSRDALAAAKLFVANG